MSFSKGAAAPYPARKLHDDDGEMCQAVHSAIEALPEAANAAYMEAVQRAPELILAESNPVIYLRKTRGNFADAASRLALYWKHRREIFGDRAFLHLDLSGQGALSHDDLVFAKQTGFVVLLPNDSRGRAVIYSQNPDSRVWTAADRGERMRCIFYFLNKVPQGGELSVVRYHNVAGNFDREMSVTVAELLRDVFPYKEVSFHVIAMPPPGGKRMFRNTLMRMFETFFRGLSFHPHVCETVPSMMQELFKHGFESKKIPQSIGGEWSYDTFNQWLAQQIQSDSAVRLHGQANGGIAAKREVAAARLCAPKMPAMPARPARAEKGLDAEAAKLKARADRKREKDLLYARERRLRMKHQEGDLKKQHSELLKENLKLKQEEKRLEGLLARAMEGVANGFTAMDARSSETETETTLEDEALSAGKQDTLQRSPEECHGASAVRNDRRQALVTAPPRPTLSAASQLRPTTLTPCVLQTPLTTNQGTQSAAETTKLQRVVSVGDQVASRVAASTSTTLLPPRTTLLPGMASQHAQLQTTTALHLQQPQQPSPSLLHQAQQLRRLPGTAGLPDAQLQHVVLGTNISTSGGGGGFDHLITAAGLQQQRLPVPACGGAGGSIQQPVSPPDAIASSYPLAAARPAVGFSNTEAVLGLLRSNPSVAAAVASLPRDGVGGLTQQGLLQALLQRSQQQGNQRP